MASIKSTCRGCIMGIADLSFHVNYGGCEYDPQARYSLKNHNSCMDKCQEVRADMSEEVSVDLSQDVLSEKCQEVQADMSEEVSVDLSQDVLSEKCQEVRADMSEEVSDDLSRRIPCDMCVMGIHGGCQK